jgi:hypothetical protein
MKSLLVAAREMEIPRIDISTQQKAKLFLNKSKKGKKKSRNNYFVPSAKTTLAENNAIMKISSSGNLLSLEEQVSKFESYKNLTGEIKQLGKLKVMKTN